MATEAALATLDPIWGVLQPLGHPLLLMGGISLAAWNHVRATRDVDLLLAESELQNSALARSAIREVPGVRYPLTILACDDLILFKLVAGRLLDRADAAALLRENREAIDFAYLHSWITRLDLRQDFDEIWREAFPGDEPPAMAGGPGRVLQRLAVENAVAARTNSFSPVARGRRCPQGR